MAQAAVAADVTAAWRAVLIIVGSVFVGEALVMFGLTSLVQVALPFHGLIDALLVASLCLLLLQRYVLRPLKQSNAQLQAEVSARRRVEQDLRIQTAALYATAHGVMITDCAGRIVWVNPALVAMTGYRPEELLGQSPSLLKSDEQDPAFYQRLWQTIQAGEVWQGELTNRRKDGTLYIEEQSITPVCDESGQMAYFIAIKTDCTQRKQAEAQLSQRNQALLELSRAEQHQRQFAEALVHATHALNSSLLLEEVLDRILEQTQVMVPCRAASVMLLRGDWVEVPRHRDVLGTTHALVQGFPLDQFPELRTVAELGTPRLIKDTAADLAWPGITSLEWIRSLVVAPLLEDRHVTGFLGVFSERPAFFTRDATACLVAFADHAAVALQNARLYRAELSARRTAETLSAASLELTRTLQLQAVLDSLLRYLGQLVTVDGAHLALLSAEGTLAVQAASGEDPWAGPARPPAALDMADTPALQSLLRARQSLIVADLQRAPRSSYFSALTAMRSWLGVPIVVGERAVGFCGLANRAPDFFTTEHMRLTEVMAAQAAVAIQNAALFAQVETGREQLQQLSRRLVDVQENERRHVARELHDDAGQALSSLKLGLHQLARAPSKPEVVAATAVGLSQMVDAVLENLHRVAMDLRPVSLDHLGLVVALQDHVAGLNRQSGVQASLIAVGFERVRLPANLETALYRISQEALTNVVRHAQATQVELLLHLDAERVRLTVEDDGIGFDATAPAPPGHIGLLGMRERCEALGGTLTVESRPGHGTTLVVELPRDNPHSDCR